MWNTEHYKQPKIRWLDEINFCTEQDKSGIGHLNSNVITRKLYINHKIRVLYFPY